MVAEALRSRRRAVSVHLIDISPTALEQSERTLEPLRARLGRRAPRDLRGGLRRAPRRSHRRGTMFVAVPRLEHRQLRPAGRARVSLRRSGAPCGPGTRCSSGPTSSSRSASCCSPTTTRSGSRPPSTGTSSRRMNRELLADFDLSAFDHRAVWRPGRPARRDAARLPPRAGRRDPPRRHDRALRAGRVHLDGELLQVLPEQVTAMGAAAGFRSLEQWIESDARFALTLFLAE